MVEVEITDALVLTPLGPEGSVRTGLEPHCGRKIHDAPLRTIEFFVSCVPGCIVREKHLI